MDLRREIFDFSYSLNPRSQYLKIDTWPLLDVPNPPVFAPTGVFISFSHIRMMMVEAQLPGVLYFYCVCAQFLLGWHGYATISRSCFAMHVCKRFLAIPGRSVRADLIGRHFWVHLDDFGEKWRISRFRFGQLRWMGAKLHVCAKISGDHWSTCRLRC